MISIVFGLLTATMFAASTLMNSRASKVIGAWSVVAWMSVAGLVVITPFVFAAGVPANLAGSTAIWWIVTGVGSTGGLVLVALALRVGKVGVVAPIVATEGAISAVLAAILGESIAPLVAFLLFVIVVGVVIAASGRDPAPIPNERPVLGVVLATLSAGAFGISLFAAGNLSDELPIPWVLLPARAVGVIALFIPLVVMGRLRITRATLPLVLAMGVAEVVGFTFFTIGAESQVAITSVLASQFAPIAAVFAYLLFRERLGRQQVAGVVVIVLGVAALAAAAA